MLDDRLRHSQLTDFGDLWRYRVMKHAPDLLYRRHRFPAVEAP
jgi:hypothetical protein